jgi:flotillin
LPEAELTKEVVMTNYLVVLTAVAFVLAFTIASLVSRFLLICQPNEVIVLSGRKRRLADGSEVGYRLIRGGRAFRIPVLERAARLSLETIPLNLTVNNAYSAGGIPLKVDAVANVKISSQQPSLGNAVERFLNKGMSQVHQIAKETLEGNLRGVLATLTPEEVNEDRLKFAQSLIEEADQDLGQLGLKLDTLKIQNVSDEVGYLDSIGRRKTAEVLSAARTAEAERQAEAEEAEAESKRRAEVARARAAQAIEVESTNLRVKRAELEKTAVVKEQEAKVAGEKAKARFEQEAEQERILLQQRRLMADVIEPAKAQREAMEHEARGAAAHILEDGQAKVRVLKEMIETYRSAAGDGEKVFMLNMLPDLVRELAQTVDKVTVDKVSVIDAGGNGAASGLGRFVNQFPAAVIALSEQIETATGVNILSSLNGHRAEPTASRVPAARAAEPTAVAAGQ